MKSVFGSIKPYWLYCIIIGIKTIEVGKDFPKADDWNKVVFLYCSQDKNSFNRIPEKDREWMQKYLGKVACRFVCDYHTSLKAMSEVQAIYNEVKNTCLNHDEIINYANGKRLYYWHISDLVIYDKPRELSEFKYAEYHYGRIHLPPRDISRPPQSWMYVESEDNK